MTSNIIQGKSVSAQALQLSVIGNKEVSYEAILGTKPMLAKIPISPQLNKAFSKGPKGVEKAGKAANDFTHTFAAAAAARRHKEPYSEGGLNKERLSKIECNKELCSEGGSDKERLLKTNCKSGGKSSKDPVSLDQPQKKSSKSQKSEKTPKSLEAEMLGRGTVSDEDESRYTEAAALFSGLSSNDQEIKTEEVAKDAKDNENLSEGTKNAADVPRSNFVIRKERGPESVPLGSQKDQQVSFRGIRDREASLTRLQDTNNRLSGFSYSNGKLIESDIHGQLDLAKGIHKPATGEENIDVENTGSSNGKKEKNIKNTTGTAVKAFHLKNMTDNTEAKIAARHFGILNTRKNPSFEKPEVDCRGTKTAGQKGIGSEEKETSLFKIRPGTSKSASDETGGTIGIEKKEPVQNARVGEKVTAPSKEGIEPREGMKGETAAVNRKDTGDSGIINQKSALILELNRNVENKKGQSLSVEKPDPGQKNAPSNNAGGLVRSENGQETDAQSSGSNTNDLRRHGEGERRSVLKGKDATGTREEMEVTKREEGFSVPKAKYGPTNGADPALSETEKEVQKSPIGKENLGSLVRTASFLIRNGRQEARIALHPESLGHLKIRISMENQRVTVRVMAETSAAKDLIEHNLHQLRADFQQQGLEVSKFDVTLSQDSASNGAGQNSFLASNRPKGKSGSKKQQSTQENDLPEKTAVVSGRGLKSDAIDFFA